MPKSAKSAKSKKFVPPTSGDHDKILGDQRKKPGPKKGKHEQLSVAGLRRMARAHGLLAKQNKKFGLEASKMKTGEPWGAAILVEKYHALELVHLNCQEILNAEANELASHD